VTAHETSNRPASQIIGRLDEEATRSKNNKKCLQSIFLPLLLLFALLASLFISLSISDTAFFPLF
jgi:hypothetical protein